MPEKYKTTFVVPTYNRSKEFISNYSFFVTLKGADKIKIIVVDGSTNEIHARANKEFCEKNGFEYYFPEFDEPKNNTMWAKALYGIKKVQTATAHLSDDEDIYSPDGVLECVDFLDKNEDYVSAAGNYRYCYFTPGLIKTAKCYISESLEQDNQLARLWSLISFYREVILHSVYKTDALFKAVEKAMEFSLSYSVTLTEIVAVSISALLGKHKRLKTDYGVRLDSPAQKSKYRSLEDLMYGPLNNEKDRTPSRPGDKPFYLSDRNYVSLMRDVLLDYLEPADGRAFDILTIALANYLASGIVYDLTVYRLYGDYVKENGFDMTFSQRIREMFPGITEVKIFYNYVFDSAIKGSIAIYGAGTIGAHIYRQIKGTLEVCCFIDRNYETAKEYCGVRVVSPADITGLNADYILIANNNAEDEIFETLMNLNIDKDKIITLSELAENSPAFTYKDCYELSFGTLS